MAARKRNSELQLNFDGLTDSVTNLVGDLILLVVLLIGVTKEAVRAPAESLSIETGENKKAPKSIVPLLDRINLLQSELQQVHREVAQLEGRLPDLRAEVEQLLRQAAAPR